MNKKYHIIAGLPRSGSTLLCSILNQNPKFHASETSALPIILSSVRMGWEEVLENKSTPKIGVKKNVMKSIVDGYYSHIDKPVIFDKHRIWNSEYHMAQTVFGENVKYILCVRDIPDILASFEKLYRKSAGFWDTPDSRNFPKQSKFLEGRCELLMSREGPIGSCLMSINELKRYTDNVAVIDFNQLTFKPEETMKEIYDFLGEESYEHDFNNVELITNEDDRIHGYLGLHKVRKKVEPVMSDAKAILGKELYNRYNRQ